MSISIRINSRNGNHVIGHMISVNGKRVFAKNRVNPQKHFCYKYRAYGISVDAYETAKRHGATGIRIVLTDGTRLDASIDMFERYAILDSLGGFEPQLFLPLQYWTQTKPNQPSLL